MDPMRQRLVRWSGWGAAAALVAAASIASCDGDAPTEPNGEPLDSALVAAGKDIFRFDTFGDEKYWTDTLRMHEVIESAVTPAAALSVGLKVDVEALPQSVKDALAAGQVDLNSTATTLALLKMNAVVGVKGQVETSGGRDRLVRFGITCSPSSPARSLRSHPPSPRQRKPF
jgi:hypothetical protein